MGLVSCDKFLDTMPDNRAEIDTPEKIRAILTTAYPSGTYLTTNEYMSDNVDQIGHDNPSSSRFLDQLYGWEDVTEGSNDSPSNFWDHAYYSIAHANQALYAIQQIAGQEPGGELDIPGIEAAGLTAEMAEALLCRAYNHFLLVNEFCLNYSALTSDTDPGIPYMEKAETKRKALENRRQAAAPVPGQNFLERTKNKVIRGCKIKKSEAKKIYNWPNLDELKSAAFQISQKCAAKKISACALINAKQGKCSEDCKYCAQSAHWNSNCQTKEMIEVSAALKIASQAAENGAERICVITSGRDLNGKDFEKALQIIRAIKEKFGGRLKVCASLGLLDKERLLAVKEAGASRAANNLETSEKYFPKICSTHTYRQKRHVVKSIKKSGLELCSGCIIGMGESVQDRIDAAFAFRKIGADSIPVNVLSPVKGTPFESLPPLADEDFYRTIAMLRFVNPKSQIRLAAGRKNFSDNGREALLSGANAFVTGGLLTLSGTEENSDLKMIEELEARFSCK